MKKNDRTPKPRAVPVFEIITILIFGLLAEVTNAQFHDQGFLSAVTRTDFNSKTESQSTNPLTFVSPCLYPGQLCGTGPTVFSFPNWFTQHGPTWPSSNYWVLSVNNEIAYDNVCPSNPDPNVGPCTPGQTIITTQNPGPPNQSLAVSPPGSGVMGYTALMDTEIGEDFYRAHLVMNGTFPTPSLGDIPYLSIGSERYRGNGTKLGQLHPWYFKKVKFKAKLWDFKLPSPATQYQPATLVFYLLAYSNWDGKRRALFITLAHWNYDNSSSVFNDFTKQWKWNWPIQESFYFPGAEYVFMDAEDVQAQCNYVVPRLTSMGQEIQYNVDLYTLFECVSDLGGWDSPMPSLPPIEGIHWAVEMTGEDGWLWASVHDMRMTQ